MSIMMVIVYNVVLNKTRQIITSTTQGDTSIPQNDESKLNIVKEEEDDNITTYTKTNTNTINNNIDITTTNEDDLLSSKGILRWYGKKLYDFTKRAKFTPLRLSTLERNYLSIIEGALKVSEYTDKVDILSYRQKSTLIHKELKDLLQLMSGLLMSSNYNIGQKQVKNNAINENISFYATMIEVARRHKIRNPEKMRDTYGKLMHALMDSVQENVFNSSSSYSSNEQQQQQTLVLPLKTVYNLLEQHNSLLLLKDPIFAVSVAQVAPLYGQKLSKDELLYLNTQKKQAKQIILKKYTSDSLTREDIELVINSFNDSHSYLQDNRIPIDEMIYYLRSYFDPSNTNSNHDNFTSLQIRQGQEGSKLSHSHKTQWFFVYQSLYLWNNIIDHMFELWILAELDLTSHDNWYRLRNTGQGLQRMQSCPRVSKKMSYILSNVQKAFQSWIGLSVVHLGDQDVPNAFIFIDKYNQIARILNPIIIILRQLHDESSLPNEIKIYIKKTFKSCKIAIQMILHDFFRNGFNGTGSNGGSCIDGRSTSAWNWCSKIAKKPYYPLFLMLGFVGFDGQF